MIEPIQDEAPIPSKCLTCSSNCKTCPEWSGKFCLSCPVGNLLITNLGKCVDKCPTLGYDGDDGKGNCLACS